MIQGTLLFIFFLSGVAGLGYEILWTRMLAVSLGHEVISLLAVMSAFFSGLALGAWFFDPVVSRSRVPGYWYAAFELVIGLWALVLIFGIPGVNPIAASLIGAEPSPFRHWSVSFLYPFLLLLPATAAMGGTLPAMDRFFCRLCKKKLSVGGLYAANTLGAMAGTLATTFVILPALGMTKTSIILALLNFMGAAGVFLVSYRPKEKVQMEGAKIAMEVGAGRLCVTLFGTGFLGIGFEVIMVRVLSQIFENTVFSFASLLSVYLLGTGVGATLYQKYVKQVSFEKTLFYLLNCIALFCLTSILLLPYAQQIYPFLYHSFGGGFWGSVLGEIEFSLLVFLLPTAAMGATFSHLAQGLRGIHGGVGKALCLNTLGGSLAPVFFGLWLIPVLGIKRGLLFIAAGYLLLIHRFSFAYLPIMVFPAAVLLLISINPCQYHFVTTTEGDTIVAHHEGVMATVSVLKDSQDEYHLKVNNHFQMGGTTSTYSDRRQAHLPLLLHPHPSTALFLGLGTGATFAGDSPLNTDDHPVVLFQAPLFVYGNPAPPQERLLTLIDILSPPDANEIFIDEGIDSQVRKRLVAYWSARDNFLKIGVNVTPTTNVEELFETVSSPLLSVVRESGDFSAAYNPLLAMAYRLYSIDREAAHQLLLDLEEANPWRREAGNVRSFLFRE